MRCTPKSQAVPHPGIRVITCFKTFNCFGQNHALNHAKISTTKPCILSESQPSCNSSRKRHIYYTTAAADITDAQTEPLGVVILAGFYLEELAAVRVMMDANGGQDIKVIVTTPGMLYQPLALVLKNDEPDWHEPMPVEWIHGQGWRQQRTVLMYQLGGERSYALSQLLASSGMGSIACVKPTTRALNRILGDILAESTVVLDPTAIPEDVGFQEDLPSLQNLIEAELQAEYEATMKKKTEEEMRNNIIEMDIIDKLAAEAGIVSDVESQSPVDVVENKPLQQQQIEQPIETQEIAQQQEEEVNKQNTINQATTANTKPLVEPEVLENEDGEGTMLPEVDNFVLSRQQLQETLEGTGLDIEDVVKMLNNKGIQLQ